MTRRRSCSGASICRRTERMRPSIKPTCCFHRRKQGRGRLRGLEDEQRKTLGIRAKEVELRGGIHCIEVGDRHWRTS